MTNTDAVRSSASEGRRDLKYAHERLNEMFSIGNVSGLFKPLAHLETQVERWSALSPEQDESAKVAALHR